MYVYGKCTYFVSLKLVNVLMFFVASVFVLHLGIEAL